MGLLVLVLLFLYDSGFLGRAGLSPQALLIQRLPVVLALLVGVTFHEFSHGLVATLFGDDVPRRAGRLTLNPLRHLDPIGTVLMFTGPIGWGRPMPINPAGMRNPALGWALSSLAGPISNLLLAGVFALVFRGLTASTLLNGASPIVALVALRFILMLVVLNVALAAFNLIPLPPLDGFGFLYGLSPFALKQALAPIWRIGPLILLALLFLPAIPGVGFPPFLTDGLAAVEGFVLNALGVR